MPLPAQVTLLELVTAVSALVEDPEVLVGIVKQILASGRVKLSGNFRDEPIESFDLRHCPPERCQDSGKGVLGLERSRTTGRKNSS